MMVDSARFGMPFLFYSVVIALTGKKVAHGNDGCV